jgi:hypothetical protein
MAYSVSGVNKGKPVASVEVSHAALLTAAVIAVSLIVYLSFETDGVALILLVILGVFGWRRYKSSSYSIQYRGRKGSLLSAYQSFKADREERATGTQRATEGQRADTQPMRPPNRSSGGQQRTVVRLSCQHLEEMIGNPTHLVGRRMLCRTCGEQRVEAVICKTSQPFCSSESNLRGRGHA